MRRAPIPRPRPEKPPLSLFSLPILACIFAIIVSPLALFFTLTSTGTIGVYETRYENKIFWPVMAALTAIYVARNASRIAKVYWPPHIICLFAYLAFAGVSVLWAFAPKLSMIRYIQQVMVVFSIILPSMVAVRLDIMRGLFLCLAIAAVLNVFFVIGGFQTLADNIVIGYSGYFLGKNYLGECAAIALLVSLHELFYPGSRRLIGILIVMICVVLLYFANSKTAIGVSLLAPILAAAMLFARKNLRLSPAAIIWIVIISYLVFSKLTGFSMGRISYMLYGDSSFTGRQQIWDFAASAIAQHPLLGWGYQSFWLVGSDGPSVFAPGWIKTMPNAHSGYYDTLLEMGYAGFVLLLAFLTTTFQSIGRMLDRDPARGWVVLSLAIYILIHNGLESTWMRGFEFMWIIFLLVAADCARGYQARNVESEGYQLFPHGSTAVRPYLGELARSTTAPRGWPPRRSGGRGTRELRDTRPVVRRL